MQRALCYREVEYEKVGGVAHVLVEGDHQHHQQVPKETYKIMAQLILFEPTTSPLSFMVPPSGLDLCTVYTVHATGKQKQSHKKTFWYYLGNVLRAAVL